MQMSPGVLYVFENSYENQTELQQKSKATESQPIKFPFSTHTARNITSSGINNLCIRAPCRDFTKDTHI